jgi:hypothetical protein
LALPRSPCAAYGCCRMLRPVRTESDLPRAGTAYETSGIDFKREVNPNGKTEMAKDVAAFANAMGGVVLVGACEDRGVLKEYVPLMQERAALVRNAYDEAVRDLCIPKPLVDCVQVPLGRGFVVAINVWPFPAQPVGVVDSKGASRSYCFPCRTGTHTIYLTPDQLPMLMLPEVRRVAILLSSIPIGERENVTLHAVPRHHLDYDATQEAVLELDLEEVTMRNTVSFKTRGGDKEFTIPADSITHVWRSPSREWAITTSVMLFPSAEGLLRAMPPDQTLTHFVRPN